VYAEASLEEGGENKKQALQDHRLDTKEHSHRKNLLGAWTSLGGFMVTIDN
jgi:hypothetical protein